MKFLCWAIDIVFWIAYHTDSQSVRKVNYRLQQSTLRLVLLELVSQKYLIQLENYAGRIAINECGSTVRVSYLGLDW